MKKILYVSGSIGLGHVPRDLAIIRQLREQCGEIDVSWLAATPASDVIRESGEKLLPECELYQNENLSAELSSQGYHLNLMYYTMKARKPWNTNVEVFKQVANKGMYDLIIGDETYEISTAIKKNPELKKFKFVMIYNFVGVDSMSSNLFEKFGAYYWNRIWSKGYGKTTRHFDLGIFVGMEEDIPDRTFGFFLPYRRDYAREKYKFVGYIINFNPGEYRDKEKVRRQLGYGSEPLLICSIGGTSIGKELLNLCGNSYPILKESIPDLRMVLVCGPRLSPDTLTVPSGVEIKTYTPNLYRHFAAADCAVVQGGHSSTMELTALQRPFLYFPLGGHCEQQLYVPARLERHRAGIRMDYSQTTPEILAEKIMSIFGTEPRYADIPLDGAQKAAAL
ncbi:MAG: hypothetical protein JSW33_09215, partial [bacterium]